MNQKIKQYMINAVAERPSMTIRPAQRRLGQDIRMYAPILEDSQASHDLAADLFWLLYDPNATILKEPVPSRTFNHAVLGWVIRSKQFEMAKGLAATSIIQSIQVTKAIYEFIMREIDLSEIMETQDGMTADEDSLEDLGQLLDNLLKQLQQQEQELDEQSQDESDSQGQGGASSQSQDQGQDDQEPQDSGQGQNGEPQGHQGGNGQDDGGTQAQSQGGDHQESQDRDGQDGNEKSDLEKSYDETSKMTDSLKEQVAEIVERQLQKAGQLQESAKEEGNKPQIRAGISAAMGAGQKAGNQIEGVARLLSWGDEDGQQSVDDINDVMDAMESMEIDQELFDLIGRFKGIAFESMATISPVGSTISGGGYVKDPEKLLDDELASLSHRSPLRNEAALNFVTNGLVGLRQKGDAEKLGPFYLGSDCSASMRGYPVKLAAAFSVALAHAASDIQRRQFRMSWFSKYVLKNGQVTSEDSWAALMKWATLRQFGGTNFNNILTHIMDQIEADDRPDGADVVLVTDGICEASTHVIERMGRFQEKGTRFFYITCNKSEGADRYRRQTRVQEAMDHTKNIDGLNDRTAVEALMAATDFIKQTRGE